VVDPKREEERPKEREIAIFPLSKLTEKGDVV